MSSSIVNTTCKITNDPTMLDEVYGLTSAIRKQIEKAYDMALSKKASNIPRLQAVVEQYPHIPHFKNYLSVLHSSLGNSEEANRIVLQTVQDHPTYLFGRLNLAKQYLISKQLDMIPPLLGETLEIMDLEPKRDTFHIDEIMSYYDVVVRFSLAMDDVDRAKEGCLFLEEINPTSEITKSLKNMLLVHRMTKFSERMKAEAENMVVVKVLSNAIDSNKSEPPVFTHPELEVLYLYDEDIDLELLHQIMILPRESVIADLELVLRDSIERYNYFQDKDEKHEVHTFFLLHALYLLGELKAKESLPLVLEVLAQHEKYYDLFFGEMIHEEVWEPIYKLADDQLDVLKGFMLEPNHYTYAKNVLITVVEQIAVHQPERSEEAANWFKELLIAYNTCSIEDNVVDSELFGFMACSLVDLIGVKAGPYLKPLFDKGWISMSVCGTYEHLLETANSARGIRPLKVLGIDERYHNLANAWKNFDENMYQTNALKNRESAGSIWTQPIEKENKVGRNDPCPCGSGKKYKKCCG